MARYDTDLALEARDCARREKELPEGAEAEESTRSGVRITRVKVESREAAERLGKPIGCYVTLEEPGDDPGAEEALPRLLAEELARLADRPTREQPVLVAGLGNRAVTPDALGPGTVERLLVTRHVLREAPELADRRLGSLAALAPGVLGVTGLETVEVLLGVAERIRPGLILAVDALAARDTRRIGTTYQICDTGIQPGGGVGNKRRALNRETLGTRVVALGVPLVVYARTIVRDALAAMDTSVTPEQVEDALRKLLPPPMEEMVVAPKEIDHMVDRAAELLAMGINLWAHPGMTPEDVRDCRNVY